MEIADVKLMRAYRDPEQTRALYEKYKPTHVIHLAALGMYSFSLSLLTWDHVSHGSWWAFQEHEIQSEAMR